MLELFEKCELCPRKCGVNRLAGDAGFCKMPALPMKISRVAPHMWEEPCLSGTKGSGTIFFNGCNLKCIFCQNQAISRGIGGKDYSVSDLAEAMLGLQALGVHNINFVTPTHYMPAICEAIDIARNNHDNPLLIPTVYNCGGYENPDIISELPNYIDIFMPDLKYHSSVLSEKYSKAPEYFRYAMASIEEMVKITGSPVFDDKGMLQKGTLVRHLCLPTRSEDSMRIIRSLYRHFGNNILLSIMNQYTPMKHFEDHPELNMALSPYSYEKIVNYAYGIGFEKVFSQEGGTVSESFIPPFNE